MSGIRNQDCPVGYRSNEPNLYSSSDDNSDEGEEDTPLWRQKKEKFFRMQKDRTINLNPMQTQPRRDSGQFMQQSKKVNNVWGSVLTEQDLTQTLVSSANVDKPNELSINERNVESYDFTKKFSDDRTSRDEPSGQDSNWLLSDKPNCGDSTTAGFSQSRSIIDYEDTVSKPIEHNDLRSHLSRRNRKRRADFSGERKHTSDIHKRLGEKKVTTTRLGEIDVNVDMENTVFVKKVADFLNEPKSELIERIVEYLGKSVALRVLQATKDTEETGGMYTVDGSRRRTPGGVYFTILKQQPEFNNKVKALIFKEDVGEYKKHRKERRGRARANKRSTQRAKHNEKNNDWSKSPLRKKDHSMEQMEDGEIQDDSEDRGSRNTDKNHPNKHSESSDISSDESCQKNSKSNNFNFEKELAAAKKLIQESKSHESVSADDMADLEFAEAHVVDIDIDG